MLRTVTRAVFINYRKHLAVVVRALEGHRPAQSHTAGEWDPCVLKSTPFPWWMDAFQVGLFM